MFKKGNSSNGIGIFPSLCLLLLVSLPHRKMERMFANSPPMARQFVPSLSAKATLAELFRTNPLLANLSMFQQSESELLGKPIDITTNSRRSMSARKRAKMKRPKLRKFAASAMFPSLSLASIASSQSSEMHQMDNFDALYQVFNATMFDMAEPEEKISRLQSVERSSKRRTMGRSSEVEADRDEGKTQHQNEKEEAMVGEEEGTTEVSESLQRALSSADGTTTTETTPLVGQEEFPIGDLQQQRRKYPWERERGEQLILPSSTLSSSSPSSPLLLHHQFPGAVVPGASFYVDQHISHGFFGRDSPGSVPELVYDPNVLQSRYGYSGMLPHLMPDGRLIRGEMPNPSHQHGVQTLQNPRRWPTTSAASLLSSATVFFLPAMPRLSVAHTVQHPMRNAYGLRTPTTRNRTSSEEEEAEEREKKRPKLGYWPMKKWHIKESDEATTTATTTTTTKLASFAGANSAKMVPLGGNHLKWMPATVVAKGVPTNTMDKRVRLDPFEDELGLGAATRRWPCQVDPPALLLADSAPADFAVPLAACFRRVRQCTLRTASAPLERRVASTRAQCVRFCVGNSRCASLTFAPSNGTCDIYSVRNGTESARLLHHRDFDYLEPKIGTEWGGTLSECWEENQPFEEQQTTPNLVLVDSGEALNGRERLYYSNRTTVPYPTTTTPSAAPAIPPASCAADRDIVVFKSLGYRLAVPVGKSRKRRAVGEPPPSKLSSNIWTQQSSETECIFSCLVNLAHGKVPFECLAATFDSVQSNCLLHGRGSIADGSVHLMPDPPFSHYEKGCIRADIVELCHGSPIVRYPQKTLLGFAIGSRHAGSLVECLELCWSHNNQLLPPAISSSSTAAHRCRSVVFFYEESGGGHNCMLNSESRDSAPAFFVEENEALVDYASFDGCYEMPEAETEADVEEEGTDNAAAVMVNKKRIRPKLLKLRPLGLGRRRKDPTKRRHNGAVVVLDSERHLMMAQPPTRRTAQGLPGREVVAELSATYAVTEEEQKRRRRRKRRKRR